MVNQLELRAAHKVNTTGENKAAWRKAMHVFKLVVCVAVLAAAHQSRINFHM